MKKKSIYLLKQIISQRDIDSIFETIIIFFKKYYPTDFKWIGKNSKRNIWKNSKFHKSLINARKKNPKKFGKIYDSLQSSVSLKKLLGYKKILNNVNKVYGHKSEDLTGFNSILRMDVPFDKRNSLGWHYDEFPNKPKVDTLNGCTLQIALHDTNQQNGSPIFLVGSEKHKSSQKSKKRRGNTTAKFSINKKILKKYNSKTFVLRPGDATLFSMKTLHRSGLNSSDKIRFTVILRYFPIKSTSYIPIRESYIPLE